MSGWPEIDAVIAGESDGCVVCADCLDVMAAMPDESVDVICTDPPYFLPATHYNLRSGSRRSLSDLGMLEHFYLDVFGQFLRIIKPTGFLYVFCDGQSYPVFYALLYQSAKAIRPLVWNKLTSINGYGWRHQHELIAYAEMPMSPSIPTGDGDVLEERAVPVGDRIHPAQKPIPLIRKLLAKSAPKHGVALDPFAGSMSMAQAASSLGLRSVSIEKDPAYAADGLRPKPLFAEPTPQPQQPQLFGGTK